jgi:hypothetical protein
MLLRELSSTTWLMVNLCNTRTTTPTSSYFTRGWFVEYEECRNKRSEAISNSKQEELTFRRMIYTTLVPAFMLRVDIRKPIIRAAAQRILCCMCIETIVFVTF